MQSVDLRREVPAFAALFPEECGPQGGSIQHNEAPQTLSSYIPAPLSTGLLTSVLQWSWAARPTAPPSSVQSPPLQTRKSTYVSREKQLARLKSRMASEGVREMPCHCRQCEFGALVTL